MLHSGIYGEHYLIFNPSRNIHFQTRKRFPTAPSAAIQFAIQKMFIVKFRLTLPLHRIRVTAARRTNNFRKNCIYIYENMATLCGIVGSSLCATWKRMLKVFKCELLFIFAADTHTHSLAACYASRPFLLPTFVRSENCEAFRACVSCARVCVCACAGKCVWDAVVTKRNIK